MGRMVRCWLLSLLKKCGSDRSEPRGGVQTKRAEEIGTTTMVAEGVGWWGSERWNHLKGGGGGWKSEPVDGADVGSAARGLLHHGGGGWWERGWGGRRNRHMGIFKK